MTRIDVMVHDVQTHEGEIPWHAETPQRTAEILESDPERGLGADHALALLQVHGPNVLHPVERWSRLRRLGRQFTDVLVLLLLGAAAASGFLLGAWVDASAVFAIVVLNAVLGYTQESRADTALTHLRDLQAPDANVIRDGNHSVVAAADLVPGDLIVLEAGDLVPADARVMASVRLELAEAPLTGESLPVEKTVDPVDAGSGIADRRSMVYAGTTVLRGRGRAIVTSTGDRTEMGAIAASVTDPPPPTPLQVDLARVGRRLGVVAVAAGALVFGAGLIQEYPVETMTLTAVAMAVAAIPEGLPAVVTVTLAGGLRRMAAEQAIVRRLPAVEALGAVDVICTDKTGTLTRGVLTVTRVVTDEHDQRPTPAAQALMETAVLCNDARPTSEGYVGDPIDVALISAAVEIGMDPEKIRGQRPRVDEAGFDGRRKRMSTVHRSRDGLELHVKGAPEVLIARCSRMLRDGGVVEVGDEGRGLLLGQAERLAAEGMRALGLASRQLRARPDDPSDVEEDLLYLGLIGLSDELRPEIPDAVGSARRAGVRTVMVTGDHLITAQSIAAGAGIEGRAMHGSELRAIESERLTTDVDQYAIFARVDPVDKVKIVHAWQESGSTVAMTGDGVNDAPALHAADIGVAMGSGTDVSREAAAMVLTDDNYATIVAAIAEGRRIFRNLRNVVHYLLSANTSEVIYMIVGFTFFGFLGEPLLAVQLLWINLLSDALPAVALGMDLPSRDLMSDPPRHGRDILSPANVSLLVFQGAVLAAASILVLLGGHYLLAFDYPTVRTMVFTTLVLAQLLHALNVRVERNGDTPRPRPSLWLAILSSALLQLVIVYTGFGNTIFRTVSLPVTALLLVLGASLLSTGVIRVLKTVGSRGLDGEKEPTP